MIHNNTDHTNNTNVLDSSPDRPIEATNLIGCTMAGVTQFNALDATCGADRDVGVDESPLSQGPGMKKVKPPNGAGPSYSTTLSPFYIPPSNTGQERTRV